MLSALSDHLAAALSTRAPLIERLAAEDTDAYRVFHGSVEGAPGLTVDRYGDVLLVQTFHQRLSAAQLAELTAFYAEAMPGLTVIWNDRSAANSRVANALEGAPAAAAALPRTFSELGVSYAFQGRHEGQDPWLFLDLRAARRRVMAEAAGKSVLNLFAYTCGVGVAATKAGATHVVNIDFSASSLQVGKDNARLNDLPIRVRFVKSDVFPALRQLAGQGQSTMVRGKRMPPFPPLEARQFDIVFLDPPGYAKSPFGVVDLVKDYPAVFNLALRTTAPGGTLICCNNVAQVARDAWLDQLLRSAKKIGRPVRAVEWIEPEADFPSPDGNPPLKVVLLRV